MCRSGLIHHRYAANDPASAATRIAARTGLEPSMYVGLY